MQTALHILGLVAQLKREIVGGRVASTEFYKKARAAYLFVKTRQGRAALGFHYHPQGSGVFLVPASKVNLDTREKPWPIFELDGARIEAVHQPTLDRIFRIDLTTEKDPLTLSVEAMGSNGNLWLLDRQDKILKTLRKRSFKPGDSYSTASPPNRLNPFNINQKMLEELMQAMPAPSMLTLLEKNILGFNRTLARECLFRSGVDFVPPSEISAEGTSALAETIREFAERFEQTETGYLYQVAGMIEVYPFKLKTVAAPPIVAASPPEKYKTLSLATLAMTSMRQVAVAEDDRRKTVTTAVDRSVKRLKRRIENVEKDIANAADYEKHLLMGEALKINLGAIRKGATEITLDDPYNQSSPLVIPLEPALSAQENAEVYFRKHRKGREGLELLERRLEISKAELATLEEIATELENNFDSAVQAYEIAIAALLPRSGTAQVTAPRLPYREHTLTTGLRIFIGRDGSDNDRTTFEFARPYELWFHAQQCAGSHVVIKFPNRDFEPSRREIEETAAIAAWHSKARNNSSVPVIYTQRKYVRKPRKAKPGLVTVEREKSIMVEPRKPV